MPFLVLLPGLLQILFKLTMPFLVLLPGLLQILFKLTMPFLGILPGLPETFIKLLMPFFPLLIRPLHGGIKADGMFMKNFTQLAHIAFVFTMGAVMLVAGDIPIGFALLLFLFFLSSFHSHLTDHQFVFLNSPGVFQHHLP